MNYNSWWFSERKKIERKCPQSDLVKYQDEKKEDFMSHPSCVEISLCAVDPLCRCFPSLLLLLLVVVLCRAVSL